MDYNLLKIYSKVSELGSFTKAALALNQPKSRVSRAIKRLESELGVELIRRTTRQLSLTHHGREFYQHIKKSLDDIESEITRISNYQQEMSGQLRITAPQDIGQTIVAAIIAEYTAQYPQVEIQTIITNEVLDLIKENIDLSFRPGRLADSTLKQRKFMDLHFIWVCSTEYLKTYGRLKSLQDLENHKFISFKNLEKTMFKECTGSASAHLMTDSIPMALNMALNHQGIAMLPDYFCKSHLQSGELCQPLPELKSKKETIHLLFPPAKNPAKRLTKFIEVAMAWQKSEA